MPQTSGTSRPESNDARARRLWPSFPRVEPFRLRTAPLLTAAVFFALGEAAYTAWRPTLLLLDATVALAALTLLCLAAAERLILLPICALWMVAGMWALQIQPAPPSQRALLSYADGLSRAIQGRVTRIAPLRRDAAASPDPDSDILQWEESGTPASSVDLELSAIEDLTPDTSRMAPISGGLRATVLDTGKTPTILHCGDLIDANVRLRAPERYRDPGAWQYADYLLAQGIAVHASVSSDKLRRTHGPSRLPTTLNLQCRLAAAQIWAAQRILAFAASPENRALPPAIRLTPDDAGMLNAMLFGDRTRLNRALRLGFERTGSFHLFVISGMHVALFAGALLWLLQRKLRLPEWLATALTLLLTAAYAALTGMGVPAQRACAMTAVFLAARLLSRERDSLNALGAAALAILVWSPRSLFEASFQMTALAIVAIAGIAGPLGQRSFLPHLRATRRLQDLWVDTTLPPRLAQFRIMLRLWGEALQPFFKSGGRTLPALAVRSCLALAELTLIGLVAELVMVLPMALYFHRATPFALPANILSIPLVTLLAPAGIATFCVSLLSPWTGFYPAVLPGAVTALLLHGITHAIAFLSHAQAADQRVSGPVPAAAAVAIILLAAILWAVRRSRTSAFAALPLLPLLAAIVLWPAPPRVQHDALEVTALDVGQGDSLLVVAPEGKTLLVDAGGPTGFAANSENALGAAGFDVGEEIVSPYLWSRQIHRLDAVALTHAHSDHMGGMPAILRNFRPRELWLAVEPDSAALRDLEAEANTLGIPIRRRRAGDAFAWDALHVSVLAPAPAYVNHGQPVNDDSLVLRLQFGQASALLEGDAEARSEQAMLAAGALQPSTLLKVGHHGSRTSTTAAFLARVAPQDAVISVGLQNTFGHPRAEIVSRLAQAHAKLFRTDEFGLTTFLLQRDGRISAITGASNPEE